MFCSKSKIKVDEREFNSVEELLESTKLNSLERQLLGTDTLFWFSRSIVKFPDKIFASSSFVEVHDKEVLVGYPNHYKNCAFNSITEALRQADKINKRWLESELSSVGFVDSFAFNVQKA